MKIETTLELDKIINKVKDYASSNLTKEKINKLLPSNDLKEVR